MSHHKCGDWVARGILHPNQLPKWLMILKIYNNIYVQGISWSVQKTILFMIEVIIFVDHRVPKGRKNLIKHDKT
jgi:hypothetical protein